MNMTPMIDITFLLLTFFMLASHFASAERVEMDLPHPEHSQALDQKFKDRLVINLTYAGPDREPGLMLGALPVASPVELADRLSEAAAVNPGAQVILRADRRLSYGDVRQVMELIAAQRLTRLQVVTEMD
ncbi:MAG TPA: biopolymer transporter ExbD [Phycisphaerae bacterium]|nr:biopolymer transporter ExbD [Phycisphaerae bacterium]